LQLLYQLISSQKDDNFMIDLWQWGMADGKYKSGFCFCWAGGVEDVI